MSICSIFLGEDTQGGALRVGSLPFPQMLDKGDSG
jgi:hypothetical protein